MTLLGRRHRAGLDPMFIVRVLGGGVGPAFTRLMYPAPSEEPA